MIESYNLLDQTNSKDFYNELFNELNKYEFDNSFVISDYYREKLPRTKKPPILLLTGDEYHRGDERGLLNYSNLIFKNYAPFNPTDRIIPFPLGYNNGFKIYEDIKISERSIDYCFIGTVNSEERYYIKSVLDDCNICYNNCYLQFNNNQSSLDREKYLEIMQNSRICICMPGQSIETTRYIEAAACGSIIVCPKLPPFWYYKNKYEFQVPSWDILPELLERVLNHTGEELDLVGYSTRKYYEDFLSPKALALYIKYFIDKYYNTSR